MPSWIVVILSVALFEPGVFEHAGVRVEVQVHSHLYTWQVTNLNASSIMSFQIPQTQVYDAKSPNGWEVTFGSEFLFTIDQLFQSPLDQGVLSEELRGVFEQRGAALGPRAGILVKEKGAQWTIRDEEKVYSLRVQNDVIRLSSERLLRGRAIDPRYAIRRDQSVKFSAQVTGYGSVLGVGTVKLGLLDGEVVAIPNVWRPKSQSRGIVILVASLLVGMALLHIWVFGRRIRSKS